MASIPAFATENDEYSCFYYERWRVFLLLLRERVSIPTSATRKGEYSYVYYEK